MKNKKMNSLGEIRETRRIILCKKNHTISFKK